MSRLLILRHAMAAPAIQGQSDFDRSLEPNGLIASAAIGTVLKNNSIFPDAVLCSPSRRTKQTLDGVLSKTKNVPPIAFVPELYTEEWPAYLQIIQGAGDYETLLLLGHNPSCEEIVHQLVATGEKAALRDLLNGFEPGTLALLNFNTRLADVRPRTGHIEQIWRG